MRTKGKKLLLLFLAVLVVGVIAFLLSLLYRSYNEIENYYENANSNLLVRSIEAQVSQTELFKTQLLKLFERQNKDLKSNVENLLRQEVGDSYIYAHEVYHRLLESKNKHDIKKRVLEELKLKAQMTPQRCVYIKDFQNNTLLGMDDGIDNSEYRDIALEAIQKVRKHGSGFIVYKNSQNQEKIMYVKNLDLFGYYLGSSVNLDLQKEELERSWTIEPFSLEKLYENNTSSIIEKSVQEQEKLLKSYKTEISLIAKTLIYIVLLGIILLIYLLFLMNKISKK